MAVLLAAGDTRLFCWHRVTHLSSIILLYINTVFLALFLGHFLNLSYFLKPFLPEPFLPEPLLPEPLLPVPFLPEPFLISLYIKITCIKNL